MAERVEHDAIPPPRSNARYPWGEWADGSTWRLTQGVDFESKIDQFVITARVYAGRRGLRVQARRRGPDLYIRFYRPQEPPDG